MASTTRTALQLYKIPTKLVKAIRSMYKHSASKVITQGIESDWFETRSEVRQGDF